MAANETVQAKAEKKDNLHIRLSKELYALDAIECAAAEFKEISRIRIEAKGDSYMITIAPKSDDDAKIVGYEFCNYVLGLMKEKNTYN